MSEQEKRDSRDLALMLKELPKEDRLQVQGVIVGLKLARKDTDTGKTPDTDTTK